MIDRNILRQASKRNSSYIDELTARYRAHLTTTITSYFITKKIVPRLTKKIAAGKSDYEQYIWMQRELRREWDRIGGMRSKRRKKSVA